MELFIEKQLADVNKTFSTLISYAIDDIKDFGSKNTAFTKTIILPGTNNNNKLFGSIFEVTSRLDYDPTKPNIGLNFNAATSARAYVFVDNMQLLKGTIRLLEIINDNGFIEYECAIVGELGGFVAELGNKKLEDLDFSAYNHTYSIANITGSWDNAAAGQGYYYPLIDYGNYSTNKADWRVGTLRPAFFVKEYLDKIFANAGYTYNSSHLNSTRFKSWIVPHNQKELRVSNTNLLIKNSLTNSIDDALSTLLEFNSPTGTLGAFTTPDNATFTYTNVSTINADLSFNINLDYTGFPTDTITLNIRKNGISILSDTYSSSGNYSYILTSVSFSTSDTLDFRITSLTLGQTFTYTANVSIISFTTLPTLVLIGDQIKIADVIPKGILQTSFLSSILKLSNLYVFEDSQNDKLLHIQPFVEFYANAKAEDWSLKLDRSKPQRIKPMSELNARYFEFNYASDSDFYNDLYKKRYNLNYGSYKYDSEFEFAKESTKVDIIFAGTPLVGYQGQDKVYSTIYKKSNNNEESVDSVIRILQAKKITGVTHWHIKSADNSSNLWGGTEYGYAGHLDDPDAPSNDLNFGVLKELFFTLVAGVLNVNQFNVYWSSYMAEITDKDSRLLTAHFKLDLKDITNIDFSKLKWIDGSLYRLNKIEDFNATRPEVCKCELLKVINKIY